MPGLTTSHARRAPQESGRRVKDFAHASPLWRITKDSIRINRLPETSVFSSGSPGYRGAAVQRRREGQSSHVTSATMCGIVCTYASGEAKSGEPREPRYSIVYL